MRLAPVGAEASAERRGAWAGEAVEAGEKSVGAYRRAAGRDPRSHEPDLARALTNLSIQRYDTGSPDAAVTSAREALARRWRSPAGWPRPTRTPTAR